MKSSGPDGSEAWCVALSACFINFVMAGLGRMAGILYVVLIETFSVDRRDASVPFSARSLTRNLLGPVVGIIGQKYGVRAATLIGGVIGTISAACCFYSYSMLWITLMWGVANGIGTALSITLPQVILAMHFKRHKTTASGISVSGGCVGSFMFPVLLEFLIWTYGLGGTFLILSGIIMNVIPAAMILKKPSWLKSAKNNPQITVTAVENRDATSMQRSHDSQQQGLSGYSNPALENDDFAADGLEIQRANIESLKANKKRILQIMIKYYVVKIGQRENKNKILFMEDNIYKQMESWLASSETSLHGSVPVSQRSSFSSVEDIDIGNGSPSNRHKVNNIEKSNECGKVFLKVPETVVGRRPHDFRTLLDHMLQEDLNLLVKLLPEKQDIDLLDQIREVRNFNTEKEDFNMLSVSSANLAQDLTHKEETRKPESNTFLTHIKTALRLHSNPLFLLVSLSRSVHFISFVPTVTIIVDFAMDKGLSVEEGKYVIAALSAGDLMGRLCLGWVTDRGYLSLPRYVLIVMIIQGMCTASLGYPHSRTSLLIDITLFGLLQGSLFVRHPVLVSKYLKRNEQSVAMGCMNFFSGCIGFFFPSYIGFFRDTIGSYNYLFCINGAIGVFVGLLWSVEPYFWRRWQPGAE